MQAAGQRCQVCHNPAAAGGKTYGPPLAGVVGRKAGSLDGFAYSDALKNSGIVWTDASLKAWMEDNDGMLPGTRMRHVGVEDKAEQEVDPNQPDLFSVARTDYDECLACQ